MELYLLRHAIAAERGAVIYPNDDRPLTLEGIKKMKKEAAGMKTFLSAFQLILTSPLKRAHETAMIVAESLQCKDKIEVSKHLLPEANSNALLKELAKHRTLNSILLVGHEPQLSSFASTLMGSSETIIEFKKGALCRIDVSQLPLIKPGRLIYHLAPKQLRDLGD